MTQQTKTEIKPENAQAGQPVGDANPAPELSDAETQEAYCRAYLEQQARLACPGCGESPFLG